MPLQRWVIRGVEPIQLRREVFARTLHRLAQGLLARELLVQLHVAPASEHKPSLLGLLPIIEPVPRVVRTAEELLRERLGHDHSATHGPNRLVQGRQEAVRVAVGGDDDLLGVELVERLDPVRLHQLGARADRCRREPSHPTRRPKSAVRRMEEGGRVQTREPRVQVLDQFDVEAVLTERLVVGGELLALGVIGGQLEAAGAAEGVAGGLGHAVEGALGQPPESSGPLGTKALARLDV
jgi:hypothetical protein